MFEKYGSAMGHQRPKSLNLVNDHFGHEPTLLPMGPTAAVVANGRCAIIQRQALSGWWELT
jgi:hypothetical protein